MSRPIRQVQAFYEAVSAAEPVVIKFSADWCPDCRRMDAFFPFIEKRFSHLPVYEVNRDQLPDLADKYEVMGIPTLLVFKEGKKIGHLPSGNAKTLHQTDQFLSSFLK
jgi:thiol-disulfide isomerase/thioredoxin